MILIFFKYVFAATLSFGKPLTPQSIKCISLNNESYLARSAEFRS